MTNTNNAANDNTYSCSDCQDFGWIELAGDVTMTCCACDVRNPRHRSEPSHSVQRYGRTIHTTTRVEFTWKGLEFVAVRFSRSDLGCRGIEIYTINEDGMEEFLRYDDRKSSLDSTARQLIAQAMPKTDSAERFSLIELV